jgi:hypothetical protein
MGGERNDSNESQHVADGGQTPGREANAAQPHEALGEHAEPERYPAVRRDDAVEAPGEGRSFDPNVNAPTPRQGAGDDAHAVNEGRTGPEADPAEGKRD